MAADLEIEALASHADRVAAEAQRAHQRMLAALRANGRKADMIRRYRRLFLDADGVLTPDAAAVIADIAAVAQLGRFDPGVVSDSEMRERNGMRRLALHILSQMDLSGDRLRELGRKMRETNGE